MSGRATGATGEARRQERQRRLGLRSSLISFVLATALVGAGSIALVLLLDPRTHEWWLVRWSELAAFVRALFGR